MGPLICGSAQIACRNLAPVGTALKDPFFPRIDNTRNETFSVNIAIGHFSTKEGQHSKYLVYKTANKELGGVFEEGWGEWRKNGEKGSAENRRKAWEAGDT